MKKKLFNFFFNKYHDHFNDKKISSDKAIDLLKSNKNLNISSKKKNGVHVVKIQTQTIWH